MSSKARYFAVAALCAVVLCLAFPRIGTPARAEDAPPAAGKKTICLFSVIHDTKDDLQSVSMALTLAGFSLDEGRDVVLFFNVRGVNVPTKSLAADLSFKGAKPVKTQLEELIKRGAKVHVCPVCMKQLDVKAEDLVEGAVVTDKPKLFANIGADTVTFTY